MKYHIIVFGCQMNISDAERVASVLEQDGYKETTDINKADLIAIVMCSVRQAAVDRVYGIIEKLKDKKVKTILTGCILEKDKKVFSKKFDYVLDIKDFADFDIMPKFSGQDAAYIPITSGCNNFCSYCVVPYTRGREISFPVEQIINRIKSKIKSGAKEIWLLGQNVNSYKDGKTSFPKLLKMADAVKGDFKLNFTSSHPKDFSDELIVAMTECQKLSMDLNLPIQSGDDEVLKRMNRPYTVAQYKTLVNKIRKALPDIRLSTDIIVGFPGETKTQFNNTVKTLKEIGYGVAFINKYSPRAGTVAAKMDDDVTWEEKKRREKVLIELVNAKNANKKQYR